MIDLTDITVFDFETSGTCPRRNRPLELAAVRYQDGVPVDQFHSFIQYDGPVPEKITELTGITDEHVNNAPGIKKVLQGFRKLSDGSVLVAHNAGFDLAFLHFARERLGAQDELSNPFLCTLTLARHYYAGMPNYKLGTLCEHFGADTSGAHQAMNDVVMCFKVLEGIIRERQIEDRLLNCLGYLKRFGGPTWRPAHAKIMAQ